MMNTTDTMTEILNPMAADAVAEDDLTAANAAPDMPEQDSPADVPEQELEPQLEAQPAPPMAAEQPEAADDAAQPDAPEVERTPELPAADSPRPTVVEELDSETQRRQYWGAILTGNPATVPAEVRKQTGADEWDVPEDRREYHMLSTLNKSWAADHLPRTREQIRAGWSRERAKLTKNLGVRDNEHELFLALSQEKDDAPRREAAERIFSKYYAAGLDGEKSIDSSDVGVGLSGQDARFADMLASEAFDLGKQKRLKYEKLARNIAAGVDIFAAAEEEALALPRMLMNVPELLDAIDELSNMKDEDRHTALYIAAGMVRTERQDKDADSLATRAVQAIRRGGVRMGYGVLQAHAQLNMALLNNASRVLGSSRLKNSADSWDRRMQMLETIRSMSQEELRPLVLEEEKGRAASYFLTAAEAVPAAALACCGGLGFSVLTLGSVGQTVAEARKRSPMSSQELQFYAGLLGGTIQAGIYLNLNRLGGNLLEQSLTRLGQASGKGLGGYTLAGLNVLGGATAEAAKMLAAGKISGAADLGAQELASILSNTASNIDWQAFGDNLTDIEANMHEAAALLPVLLLGSGRLGLQHFRSERAILGDGQLLLEMGVPQEQVAAIYAEPRVEVRSNMVQEAFRSSGFWGSQEFLTKAELAMRLLSVDKYMLTYDKNGMHDFLNLPPEKYDGPLGPGQKLVDLPMPGKRSRVATDMVRALNSTRRTEALHTWAKWWDLAGNRDFGAPEREVESLSRTLLSRFPGEDAVYDELNRLQQLSYNYLINYYSIDALMMLPGGIKEWEEFGELQRTKLLLKLAEEVVRQGPGEKTPLLPDEDPEQLISQDERMWKVSLPGWDGLEMLEDLRRTYPSLYQEKIFEHSGVFLSELHTQIKRAAAYIPTLPDFQTMLTRGLSLEEAYINILSRKLDLSPIALMDRCFSEKTQTKNATPMREYSEINREKYEIYRMLSGHEVEEWDGDDGRTYYQTIRPNGDGTYWHSARDHAINDLAGNAALMFMPDHGDISLRDRLNKNDEGFNLLQTPMAGNKVFSTYDHLCEMAMSDLNRYWDERAPTMQPGVVMDTKRYYMRGRYEGKDDGVTPIIYKGDGRSDFVVDDMSEATPLAIMQTRFYVYWMRMLRSRYVNYEQAMDYLHRCNYLSDEEVEALPRIERTFITEYDKKTGKSKRRPSNYDDDMATKLGKRMADYTLYRFLGTLDRRGVPNSVRNWVYTAAFAPEVKFPPLAPGKKRDMSYIRRDQELTMWANRRVAKKIRDMAPRVEQVRNNIIEDELMDPLFIEAFGEDVSSNSERAWSYRIYGKDGVEATSASMQNMLRSPMKGWNLLDKKVRDDLMYDLNEFCLGEEYITQSPEVQGPISRVNFGLKTLDNLINEFPQIHMYSLIDTKPGCYKRMRITRAEMAEERSTEAWAAEGVMDPGCTFEDVEYDYLPLIFHRRSKEMHAAVGMLDKLRQLSGNMPYADQGVIHWNGEKYGGEFKAPHGLEEDYVRGYPLMPLIGMLRDIGEHNRSNRSPLKVCGETLRGLDPRLDVSPLVRGVTMYRHHKYPAYVYRLMPGNLNLNDGVMHRPYLVHSRYGVFLDENRAMQEDDSSFNEKVMVPLHKFWRQPLREYQKHGPEWAAMAWKRNLLEALEVSKLAFESGSITDVTAAHLQEFVLRLAEDSGFSDRMQKATPAALTMGEAKLINILGDMMTAACSPKPMGALKRLRDIAIAGANDWETLRPVVATIINANGEAPGATYSGRVYTGPPNEKAEAQKPLIARKRRPNFKVIFDVESEKMPVRSGRKREDKEPK